MKGLAASQPSIQFTRLRLDLVLILIISYPLARIFEVNQDIYETTNFRPTKSLQ